MALQNTCIVNFVVILIYQIIGGVTRALGPALNGIGGMVGDSDPTARDVLRGIGTGLTMGGGIVDQFGNLFNPNGNPQQQPGMGYPGVGYQPQPGYGYPSGGYQPQPSSGYGYPQYPQYPSPSG